MLSEVRAPPTSIDSMGCCTYVSTNDIRDAHDILCKQEKWTAAALCGISIGASDTTAHWVALPLGDNQPKNKINHHTELAQDNIN
jgi:hypothetical protein